MYDSNLIEYHSNKTQKVLTYDKWELFRQFIEMFYQVKRKRHFLTSALEKNEKNKQTNFNLLQKKLN